MTRYGDKSVSEWMCWMHIQMECSKWLGKHAHAQTDINAITFNMNSKQWTDYDDFNIKSIDIHISNAGLDWIATTFSLVNKRTTAIWNQRQEDRQSNMSSSWVDMYSVYSLQLRLMLNVYLLILIYSLTSIMMAQDKCEKKKREWKTYVVSF